MNIHQKIFSTLLTVFAVSFCSLPAISDEGHPHKEEKASAERHGHQAPHGGKMATVGAYHAEVVVEAGIVIKVFLYDSGDTPVPVKGVSGQIHLTYPDNHRETLELAPASDQSHFSAQMIDPGHHNFNAVLSLVIDGQRQNVRLNL